MDCNFAIYCDTAQASDIKIHKEGCGHIKKLEGHDHEWFYAPTLRNALEIAELLESRGSIHGDGFTTSYCQHCKPSE